MNGDPLYHHLCRRPVARPHRHPLQPVQRVPPVDDLAERHVAAVQGRVRPVRDEELGPICVRPGVCHGHHAPPGVAAGQPRRLITELAGRGVEDGPPALPRPTRVAALDDEALHIAMEGRPVVRSRRGQGQEVLAGDGAFGAGELQLQVAQGGVEGEGLERGRGRGERVRVGRLRSGGGPPPARALSLSSLFSPWRATASHARAAQLLARGRSVCGWWSVIQARERPQARPGADGTRESREEFRSALCSRSHSLNLSFRSAPRERTLFPPLHTHDAGRRPPPPGGPPGRQPAISPGLVGGGCARVGGRGQPSPAQGEESERKGRRWEGGAPLPNAFTYQPRPRDWVVRGCRPPGDARKGRVCRVRAFARAMREREKK